MNERVRMGCYSREAEDGAAALPARGAFALPSASSENVPRSCERAALMSFESLVSPVRSNMLMPAMPLLRANAALRA